MKAAIYCRISRDPAGLRAGVERQEADCRAYCGRRGWDVGEVYVDNDVSAYSGKPRPGYRRMLADLEAGTVGAVVAWHNDRLHRSPAELEEFITVVERTGAAVAVVEGGDYDLSSSDGRLAARIVGAVARKESEDKSRRLRRKHLALAQEGKGAGGQRPFGFEPGMSGVREPEAELVREAARRVLQGESLRSVAGDWQRRGLVTATGSQWTSIALKRVLRSARIAGLRDHQGATYPAAWPAIIDRETHEELVALLSDPARRKNGGSQARRYLVTGFAYCGVCGGRLVARPRADGRRSYVCASGVGFGGCGKIRRLAEPVEGVVVDYVLRALDTPETARAVRGGDASDVEARQIADDVERDRRRLARLEDALVDGDMDKATYRRRRAECEAHMEQIQRRLAELSGLRAVESLPVGVEALREAWDAFTLEQRRAVVQAFITRVVVQPARKGDRRFDPAKIELWGSDDGEDVLLHPLPSTPPEAYLPAYARYLDERGG